MRSITRLSVLAAAGAALAGAVLHSPPAPVETRSASATFAKNVVNPWYPLVPGEVSVLRGRDESGRYRERTVVLHRTKLIEGVRCRIVLDVVRRLDGSLAERTHDFYATDDGGRVWYYGENTATYRRDGSVDSREGTWRAGRHGARPGVIMPAHPRVTQAFRQEYLHGVAEDQAWIVQRGASVHTPARTFPDTIRSLEWSRLEPGVVSVKFYARGIGIVAERDLSGGHEVFRLVRHHH